jgi:hypothetical protein
LALLVLTVVGALTNPVSANSLHTTGTTSGTDPTGDNAGGDCHVDITSFTVSYDGSTLTMSVTVACGADPMNSPEWKQGMVRAVWNIALDFGAHSATVDLHNDGSQLLAPVTTDSAVFPVCDATPSWDGANTYTVTLGSDCPLFVAALSVRTAMQSSTCSTCDLAPDAHDSNPVDTTGGPPLPFPPPPGGYATTCAGTQNDNPFPDAGLAADCLKAFGIALGKNDGTFGEDDPLFRSQVSSLLARLLGTNGIALDTRRSFPDVNPSTVPNAQVRDEIEQLAGAGVIAGLPDGTFNPGGYLSNAQMATFVLRSMQLLHGHVAGAPDLKDQGTTPANFIYDVERGLLDIKATGKDLQFDTGSRTQTDRGLIADTLAQALQQLGKIYYSDCNAAAAAGATPLHRGDPGYRPALDPDGDGTAC